jgi:hypothetical protein
LVSVRSNGKQGDGISGRFSAPSVSADGQIVAFDSAATNLVGGDSNRAVDEFVRDRLNGTTERVAANAARVATVTSTNFTTGGATATETVLASDVTYWSGPATPPTTGSGTFTPGQVNAAAAVPLSTAVPVTAFTHTGGTGNNAALWNPTLDVAVPLANQAGSTLAR